MITLYGIKNCDSVKKARQWLRQHALDHHFHDFRVEGLPAPRLDDWLGLWGWETLLNRRGSTWRQLPESLRRRVDAGVARALMLEQPTLIKRPVLVRRDACLVGYTESTYQQFFSLQGKRPAQPGKGNE